MADVSASGASADSLRPENIAPYLKQARRLRWLEETDSTNNEARRAAQAGDPGGVVFLAERQTAGKGRLGRSWESHDGQEVQMSFLLRPRIAPRDMSGASFAAGIGIAEGIRSLGVPAMLKWPNDVVVGPRKVCGILVESAILDADSVGYVVVGTGINVNQESFRAELADRATSLRMEKGEVLSRPMVAAVLMESVLAWMERFFEGGMDAVMDAYRRLSCVLGRQITVETEEGPVVGRCVGFGHDGRIEVDCGGTARWFSANDVSVRRAAGYA